MCEPSLPVRVALKMSCWTSFLLLADSPNQLAKWPLADTPFGSSGVNVTLPSSVPVTQNSSCPGAVNSVTWKTSLAAMPVTVPGSPVHGFADASENSTTSWACCVNVTVPGGLPAEATSAETSATTATTPAAVTRRLSISFLSPRRIGSPQRCPVAASSNTQYVFSQRGVRLLWPKGRCLTLLDRLISRLRKRPITGSKHSQSHAGDPYGTIVPVELTRSKATSRASVARQSSPSSGGSHPFPAVLFCGGERLRVCSCGC